MLSNSKMSLDDILEEYAQKKENIKKQHKKPTFDANDFFLSEKNKRPSSNRKSLNSLKQETLVMDIRQENPIVNEFDDEKLSTGNDEHVENSIDERPNSPFIGQAFKETPKNNENIDSVFKIKKEHPIHKTTEVTPINRKKINDIDLDIKSKIIPKTEQITLENIKAEEERLKDLEEKRNKKIRDFVLETNDTDESDDYEEEIEDKSVPENEFDEYDDMSAAADIVDDISQIKHSLVIRAFLLLICFVLSSYTALANDFGLPIIEFLKSSKHPISYLMINIIIGMISTFIASSAISSGFKSIVKLNANSDSIPAIAIASNIFTSFIMLADVSLLQNKLLNIYIPIAIGSLLFNTLGKILIIYKTERNFKFVSSDSDKYALFQIEDQDVASRFTKGSVSGFPCLATMKKTEFIDEFLKSSFGSDVTDSFCKIGTPLLIGLSVVVAIINVIFCQLTTTGKIILGLATFSGTIALVSSFALMFIVNLPMARATKKLLLSSSCMLGYNAVEEFSETNSVLVDMTQLFPEGSVELVNLKQLSSTSIEEGILLAASLSCHAGSVLKSTFFKMLKGKTEMLYPVESYLYEDTLGISGWIENKRVLFGTRELMKCHSIEGLPGVVKESDYAKGNLVLYLSVSGVVTTMFIVQLKTSLGVTKWLGELEKQDISIVLHSVDAMITPNLLSEMFDVSPSLFKLVPFRYHKKFDEQTTFTEKVATPLICAGKFQSFAMLITSAKRLAKSSVLGMTILISSFITGILLALIMSFLSMFNVLNTSIVLLINTAWLIITYILLRFRKT